MKLYFYCIYLKLRYLAWLPYGGIQLMFIIAWAAISDSNFVFKYKNLCRRWDEITKCEFDHYSKYPGMLNWLIVFLTILIQKLLHLGLRNK